MTKEERIEMLRQERITRRMMTHVVDSLYESSYSILFDFDENIIKDMSKNTTYENFFDSIEVSDEFFNNNSFINMVLDAYKETYKERDEEEYYLPPSIEEITENMYMYYEEIIANMSESEVIKTFKEDGREDEIGGEEYIEEIDMMYEMYCETVYSYSCADMEHRTCIVLDNFGLTYTEEFYGKSPFQEISYSYTAIVNSSKRLLFEDYNPDMLTKLGGCIVTPAPEKGGEINVDEDVERGHYVCLRAVAQYQ